MEDNTIYNPKERYHKEFKNKFNDAATSYFNKLVKDGCVNEEENRLHVASYNKEKNNLANIEKEHSSLKTKKVLLIIAEVLLFVGGTIILLVGFQYINTFWWLILIALLLYGVGIALIVTVNKTLKKKLNDLSNEIEVAKKVVSKALSLCYEDLKLLNSLYDWNMVHSIIKEVTPIIEIDEYFTTKRLSYLVDKFGLTEDLGKYRSVLGVVSGEIEGNPFAIVKTLNRYIINKRYDGSLTIHWTTTYRDSDGKIHTQHHTQTLHASVTKPAPSFSNRSELIYGNEAAPHLSFSRVPSYAHKLSDKEQKNYVNKRSKELKKKAEDAIKKGKTFTAMGNEEFDAFFAADDRDNEVEFRLLFTPLAQKNELELIKKQDPYGDDFKFRKNKMINILESAHSLGFDYNINPEYFINYDIDNARNKFINYMNTYFESFYFDLAPLLSIPLYQMNKPHEYIYKEIYETNITSYEHETIANKLDKNYFMPVGANPSIPLLLKEANSIRNDNTDTTSIHVSTYKTIERVDYVPTLGGDGHLHDVPVEWTEYIEIEDVKDIQVGYIGGTNNKIKNTATIMQTLGKNNYHYERGLLGIACSYSPDFDNYLKELKNQYNK